jgi:hypothetical protein
MEVVMEHVMLCVHSQDPLVSIEPLVQGPAKQILEAAQVDVQEVAKVRAERFEHQPEDT